MDALQDLLAFLVRFGESGADQLKKKLNSTANKYWLHVKTFSISYTIEWAPMIEMLCERRGGEILCKVYNKR